MYDFIASNDFNISMIGQVVGAVVSIRENVNSPIVVYERISSIDIDRLELFMHYVIELIRYKRWLNFSRRTNINIDPVDLRTENAVIGVGCSHCFYFHLTQTAQSSITNTDYLQIQSIYV